MVGLGRNSLGRIAGSLAVAVCLVFGGVWGGFQTTQAQEGGLRLVTTELRSNDACDTTMVEAQKAEFPVCFVRAPKKWVEVVDLSGAIDLDVKFEFDSARLTPEAEDVLRQLVSAMNDPQNAAASFTVEGHTDAVGTDAYNLGLSDRRAASVVQFLTANGVQGGRLQSVGKGESELLDPNDPQGAVNRRVRVINTSANS